MTFENIIIFLIVIIILENIFFMEPLRVWISSKIFFSKKEEIIEEPNEMDRVIHFLNYQNEYIKVVEEFERIKNERIERIYFNKMISDKMAGTASMTDEEAIKLRDDVYMNIIANLPKHIREIIFFIYTEEQLKLIILDNISNKLREYYKVSKDLTKKL